MLEMKLNLLCKKKILVPLIVGIVLIGFAVFAKNFEIALPFDQNRMKVIFCPAIVVKGQEGMEVWEMIGSDLDPVAVQEAGFSIRDVVAICYDGICRIASGSDYGRTILRDGETVRVVYFHCTKTLWDILFFSGKFDERETSIKTGSTIYGDDYNRASYEPQMFEFYYLPIKNLYETLEPLSDEEFDQQREQAFLVWKGTN